LIDLTVAIIDPYCRDMKDECDKNKPAWHKGWVQRLDEEDVQYVAKYAYTSYELYRQTADMRKCLFF
jgi:hypothetical protein